MKEKRRMHDGSKTLWNMDRVIAHFDRGERIAPVHIDMGIAKFCNINCIFCYGLYQNPAKEFIQRDALLQTMKDAGEIGVRSIGFIGDGEPTCNPNVYEGLREGKKAGIDMAISTNGVTVDDVDKQLAIVESCEWMRFCLAAGTRKGYKKIHRVDKFDRVIRNIEGIIDVNDFSKAGCDIGLQSVHIPKLMDDEVV